MTDLDIEQRELERCCEKEDFQTWQLNKEDDIDRNKWRKLKTMYDTDKDM